MDSSTQPSRTLPLFQVDAFTEVPFAGNPAAVCLLDEPLSENRMQAVAAEMNLSETAFVQRLDDVAWRDAQRLQLRWFTPLVEVDLCGHATLATAAVLFDELGSRPDVLAFETRSGMLAAHRDADGIRLDFPADPPLPTELPEGIAEALGTPEIIGAHQAPSLGMLLLELEDADAVRGLRPRFARLDQALVSANAKGLIVTAQGEPPYDLVSRFFAPTVGIDEDPVTGSAHTVLGPFWAHRLQRRRLHAHQDSHRGGSLYVEMLPRDRVALIGQARVVLEGKLRLHQA